MIPLRHSTPFVFPLALAAAVPAQAQQRYDETVVVTGSAEPARLSELGRTLDVLTRERLQALPVRTLSDALRLAGGLEVRSRGDGGVQTDFALRGASFNQTLVLVDGVRLNDSQTGHHDGDIPVPLLDVSRIEVLEGPGSSLYGADAFGGVIHVVTRREGPRLAGELAGGSFGYGEAAVSGRLPGRRVRASLSLTAQRSDGFVADRDFTSLSGRSRVDLGPHTRLTLAHLDKEFGALGFYGPAPSREWTRQTLASFDRTFEAGRRTTGNLLAFVRAHGDRFVYDRRNAALSDNRHDSRAAGLGMRLHRALGRQRVSVGAELGADWLDSTSLGQRGYGRGSAFAEIERRQGRLAARSGLRLDAYGRFGSSISPSLALAAPIRSGLRWRASGGRAFRVPTFTELYYRDPNHTASSALGPERARGADLGLDWDVASHTGVSVTAFGRWESDVIDWVRGSAGERWHTENVRDVDTRGVETTLRCGFGPAELRTRYAWLETEAPALALQSKYVMDFARHVLGFDLSATLPGSLRLAPVAEYRRKADGRHWWRVDVRAARRFGRLELYADGRNLLDARYQEVHGADMPGRSLIAGLRTAP